MSIILRVDVDRAYMTQPQNYLRTFYGVFPAVDSLGYLEHCKKMADDLDTLTPHLFGEHIQSKCLIQIQHLLGNFSNHATLTHFKMVNLAVFE